MEQRIRVSHGNGRFAARLQREEPLTVALRRSSLLEFFDVGGINGDL